MLMRETPLVRERNSAQSRRKAGLPLCLFGQSFTVSSAVVNAELRRGGLSRHDYGMKQFVLLLCHETGHLNFPEPLPGQAPGGEVLNVRTRKDNENPKDSEQPVNRGSGGRLSPALPDNGLRPERRL